MHTSGDGVVIPALNCRGARAQGIHVKRSGVPSCHHGCIPVRCQFARDWNHLTLPAVALAVITALAGCGGQRPRTAGSIPTAKQPQTAPVTPAESGKGVGASGLLAGKPEEPYNQQVYRNRRVGYSVSLPPQWMFTRKIKGVDAAMVLRSRPNDFPLVTVETIRVGRDSSFHSLLKKVGKELTRRYEKVEFIKDEEVRPNVYQAIYRARASGQRLMIMQIFAKEGDWFAVLSAMDREASFNSHKKDFQAVFESIRSDASS